MLELIIVILVIAIIITLAIPQFLLMREKAIVAEATNVLGAWSRDAELGYRYSQSTGFVPPGRPFGRYYITPNWMYEGPVRMYASGGSGISDIFRVKRRRGIYRDTVIVLSATYGPDGTTRTWSGDHPCVPK